MHAIGWVKHKLMSPQIMGIKTSAVGRLESSLFYKKHSPQLSTLKKYAHALGHKLELILYQKNLRRVRSIVIEDLGSYENCYQKRHKADRVGSFQDRCISGYGMGFMLRYKGVFFIRLKEDVLFSM